MPPRKRGPEQPADDSAKPVNPAPTTADAPDDAPSDPSGWRTDPPMSDADRVLSAYGAVHAEAIQLTNPWLKASLLEHAAELVRLSAIAAGIPVLVAREPAPEIEPED